MPRRIRQVNRYLRVATDTLFNYTKVNLSSKSVITAEQFFNSTQIGLNNSKLIKNNLN